jgi:hypothetical protein
LPRGLRGSAQEFRRAPSVTLQKDEREDQVVVTAVEAGFEWETLGLKGEPAGTQVSAGGADEAPAIQLIPDESRRPSSSAEEVLAGDVLRFCATDGTLGPVTYSIAEMETNTLVSVVTFQDVARCS